MRISYRFTRWIADLLISRVGSRQPDFLVGADDADVPYLRRWYLTPWRPLQGQLRDKAETHPTMWNRFAARAIGLLPNLYLHQFLRDDDDRALHDHPSWSVSYMLRGAYIEHTIAPGGVHYRTMFCDGYLRFIGSNHAHRIELLRRFALDDDSEPVECWTLFLMGPYKREWHFHCPNGLVHWRRFTAEGRPGERGRGCG